MESNNKTISFGAITVDKVQEMKYKPGFFEAQVRQIVKSEYKQAANDSLGSNIYTVDEVNAGQANADGTYNETRVDWISVPAGQTAAQVEAKIATVKGAKIMRYLGLKPILSEQQLRSMESGVNDLTPEAYIAKQAIPGVEYKGFPTCRVTRFVATNVPDVDNRERDYIELTGDVSATTEFQMGTAKVEAPAVAEKF